ncbi:beta-galactosidase [Paenibacillus phyllosphaerae]|uniref:Beta-galactosidase n=1 Tax=Paenibacillus phyllosphaerae TaxID=274593 RepID=A0A7W5AWV3_9BACL|nr:beta-galactosidase [Paenibacillus phyllosphaerae]MBB3110283.1 beta-galactosidase [Paenibacillus phyllosphaerae]
MSTSVNTEPVINLSAQSIRIQGEPVLLMSASLFYFRIPHQLWRERMEQVKESGYNCIDVYFPWNYHEREEGSWDFKGQRDVAAFLQLAQEVGLWVVARPGPYICSEWDGGALPAYLFAKDEVQIRQNDPAYLAHVSRWFDQILPILKAYEVGAGGTVICVQLDNELDFFACDDPEGYIGALRDMAIAGSLTIPLIACAGQGGLFEASGLADGVIPTCNFYPNDRDPEFEHKVREYRDRLANQDYPLMVTETNRSHYLLRRLLSAGAKLLGPYLQVSGTDFGFTNATNNWGKPLAFLTSDYDFHGMISPEGHVRKEAYEGRLLSRIIDTYGRAIAEAAPVTDDTWSLQAAQDSKWVYGPHLLALQGGGKLIFLTNGSDDAQSVTLAHDAPESESKQLEVNLPGGRSIIVPTAIPLTLWGMKGELVQAGAELYDALANESGAVLAFHSATSFEIELDINEVAAIDTDSAQANRDQNRIRITLSPTEEKDSSATIMLQDGRRIILVGTTLGKALYSTGIDETGSIYSSIPEALISLESEADTDWRIAVGDGAASMSEGTESGEAIRTERADFLERNGIYRGYAWYEGVVPSLAKPAEGLLVHSGSDVVSLYADGEYAGTVTPGGSSRYVAFDAPRSLSALTARVEIWGHTNFDDSRLPGLKLHALKGIQGLSAVLSKVNLTSNWRFKRQDESGMSEADVGQLDDKDWAIVSFGGWLSPANPAHEVLRRSYVPSSEASSFIVQFDGVEATGQLFVDGRLAGSINEFDPFLDITNLVQPGVQTQLTVVLERPLGRSAGRVFVYETVEAGNWRITAAEEEGLLAHAAQAESSAEKAAFPLQLGSGDVAWLYGTAINSDSKNGWRVHVAGEHLKLTVFFDDTIVGRLWLPGGLARPVMTGGDPCSFYLPGPWFNQEASRLSIMLEAIDPQTPGVLSSLTFRSV